MVEAQASRSRAQVVAEVGLAVALAVLLRYLSRLVPFFTLPQGGSISLEMLPIVVVAFRQGVGGGVTAGAVFGLLDVFLEPAGAVAHPAQFILDFPVAFGLVGLAGLFRGTAAWQVAAGTLLGGTLRFSAHFISGMIFFGSYAPKGQPVWLYSLIYNGSYMVPSTILTLVLAYPILKGLEATKVRT